MSQQTDRLYLIPAPWLTKLFPSLANVGNITVSTLQGFCEYWTDKHSRRCPMRDAVVAKDLITSYLKSFFNGVSRGILSASTWPLWGQNIQWGATFLGSLTKKKNEAWEGWCSWPPTHSAEWPVLARLPKRRVENKAVVEHARNEDLTSFQPCCCIFCWLEISHLERIKCACLCPHLHFIKHEI